MTKILILPGDGVGPEVAREARRCLELMSDRCRLGLNFPIADIGGVAIDRHGSALPDATLEACRSAQGILLGAVGGPKWEAGQERPEAGLLKLRAELGLFANLRPATVLRGLEELSLLKADAVRGADILVVRELIGGCYFGEKALSDDFASDTCTYTRAEIERVARLAFDNARRRRKKVTSIDKANVLATSRLWRRVVAEVSADYPDVTLEHMLVDAAALALIARPRDFDVVVTENMFGDILSDELAALTGSIGLLPSGSIGAGAPAVFEPIHGSAPDIAGLDIANPAGAILSAAMLLDHALDSPHLAEMLVRSVEAALAEGCRTADLGGSARCSEFGAEVRARLAQRLDRQDALHELIAMNRGCCG